MKVTFFKKDKEYYGVDDIIIPVVDVASNNEKFVLTICEILNLYHTYNPHICHDIRKHLELAKFRLDKNNKAECKEYEKLCHLIDIFYWKIVEDDDFTNNLRKFNQDIYEDEKLGIESNRLARYRGLMLEELTVKLVEDRFAGETFCKGCIVKINGTNVEIRYNYGNTNRKETIDVAGWIDNVRYGEFYECKVNPDRFKTEHYRYLQELKNQLDKNKVMNSVIAFVSTDSTRHMIAQKHKLEMEEPSCNSEFEVIGREDLYMIKGYCIPDIA